MKGRYKKKGYLWVRFDLNAGADLGMAYAFFYNGTEGVKKAYPQSANVQELEAIVQALTRDVLEHNEAIAVSKNHNICIECGAEIDFRTGNHTRVLMFKEVPVAHLLLYKHRSCPKMKPDDQRNL